MLAARELTRQAVALFPRPTRSSTWGTWDAITCLGRPMTSRAKATFSNTVLFGQKPVVLEHTADVAPQVGNTPLGSGAPPRARQPRSDPRRGAPPGAARRDERGLTRPGGPYEKTNSPFSMSTDRSRNATVPVLVRLADVLETDHRRRKTPRQLIAATSGDKHAARGHQRLTPAVTPPYVSCNVPPHGLINGRRLVARATGTPFRTRYAGDAALPL